MKPAIARDWFSFAEDFKSLCSSAAAVATGPERQFTEDMLQSSQLSGLETHLSDYQLSWLCTIADIQKPHRIKR